MAINHQKGKFEKPKGQRASYLKSFRVAAEKRKSHLHFGNMNMESEMERERFRETNQWSLVYDF